MKTLKTQSLEVLKDLMPKIEKMLANQQTTSNADGPYQIDCVSYCMSATYALFGYTDAETSQASLQIFIDNMYRQYDPSAVGQGVRNGDFYTFMTAAFTGGSITISKNFSMPTETNFITVVANGHASQLLSVDKNQALLKDLQNGCVNYVKVSNIQMAYMATGVITGVPNIAPLSAMEINIK